MILDKVLGIELPSIEHTISEKDCILYSLGIGLGMEPVSSSQLQFVYEDGLVVFPSQSVVIAHPGAWVTRPELEINWLKLLHGEQAITQHKPLSPGSTYVGNYRVLGVVDKGAEKGSILYQEKTLSDKLSGDLVSTVTSSYFMRGDGGCGSSGYQPETARPVPERDADEVVEIPTAPNSALIYRLSGDYNPIHADPVKAAKAGFERPILHGLCSFGIATRAVLETCCDNDPRCLGSLGLRFSKPVYPGETIVVSIWRESDDVRFSAKVKERDIRVLDQGWATVKSFGGSQ
ncbi:MAG: MaoC/PaaZ C-terminal domain-containing protein [Pseudomonadales bacterium]